MPRALVLGNGTSMVCLDEFGFVRDFYFPYIGLENHVAGHKHRVGVSVNGVFSWLDDGSWNISIGYQPKTMVGYLVCKSEKLQLSLVMEDVMYNESDVFLRKIEIYNHAEQLTDVKVFFSQVFLISESIKRNTAFYDPTHNSVVHYKGRRVFIVNGRTASGEGIDQYTVGAYQFEGMEGAYKDAEDGNLSANAVEHGSVDSVVRFCSSCEGKNKTTIYYWICAAKTLDAAYKLNEMVLTKTPDGMLHSTESYWNAWLEKRNFHTNNLSPLQQKLFDTSLFVLRAHVDNKGAIIASADSAMIEYGKDDYSYVWPRDAAFIAYTLDLAGFWEVTKPFFQFCQRVLHPDGYLHHRYRCDESLGSTWHSTTSQTEWLKDRILQLPIQEDETAGVLYSLWQHYEQTKNIEFIEEIYKPFIEKAALFLCNFRDKDSGLPLPSYDLWEEKIGVSTYTCAAVYGGLIAAAKFSEVLGKRNHMREYLQVAKEIKEAAVEKLFSPTRNAFARIGIVKEGRLTLDETIDSSTLYGLWYFGMLEQDHPKFISTLQAVNATLINPEQTSGYIRYENDRYFMSTDKPNPWIISTLWEAQRRLHLPEVSDQDLEFVRTTFDWVVKYMYPSGVLAEQLNPYSGESRSATPLVWSHAVYVQTVLKYIEVLERKGLCLGCDVPMVPTI